jgi:hypothetical protein
MITFLAVFAGFAVYHSVDGLREVCEHRIPNLMRSTSVPNLRMLYNETSTDTNNKGIISYDEYKSNIYNRYKRNTYLRSKEKYTLEKYTFDNK